MRKLDLFGLTFAKQNARRNFMNALKLLGTGLLKKEKKSKKISVTETKLQQIRKRHSVHMFLREILGTGLIKREKKY